MSYFFLGKDTTYTMSVLMSLCFQSVRRRRPISHDKPARLLPPSIHRSAVDQLRKNVDRGCRVAGFFAGGPTVFFASCPPPPPPLPPLNCDLLHLFGAEELWKRERKKSYLCRISIFMALSIERKKGGGGGGGASRKGSETCRRKN